MTRETNVEFITRLMEYAPTGALSQIFIIDALDKWSQRVIADEASIVGAMEGGIVSGEAWVRTAKYIQAELRRKYMEVKNV